MEPLRVEVPIVAGIYPSHTMTETLLKWGNVTNLCKQLRCSDFVYA